MIRYTGRRRSSLAAANLPPTSRIACHAFTFSTAQQHYYPTARFFLLIRRCCDDAAEKAVVPPGVTEGRWLGFSQTVTGYYCCCCIVPAVTEGLLPAGENIVVTACTIPGNSGVAGVAIQ